MTEVADGATCVVCARRSGYDPAFAGLERCLGCGFVTFRDLAGFDPGSLYDEEYFAGKEYPDYLGQQDALRRSMRRHLRQMARYRPLGGRLLEVGCAYGLFLDEARAHFTRVVGMDISEPAVTYAREQLDLDARIGDFAAADLRGERFDAVCMWDTIEHVLAPHAFVEHARDALDDGGMLYLTTGDLGSRNARWRRERWRQIHPPTHVNYFSRATMRLLLERLGFEVIGFETAAYFHTLYNVLASIRLRRRSTAGLAGRVLAGIGERRARTVGFWLNLGDIMFVAARKA